MFETLKNFISENTAQFFIAQGVCAIASVLLLSSYQFKTHQKILLVQAASGLLFTIQYLLLGAYTGAICNFVGAIRGLVYSKRNQSKAVDSIFCPIFFTVLFLTSNFFTFESWYSFLPMAAMAISSFVLWSPKTQKLRALTLPTSVMWLVYNASSQSYMAIITEILNEFSIIISLYRYRNKQSVTKS